MARAAALGSCGRLLESRADLVASLELLPAAVAARTRVIAACAGVERLLGEHAQARARLAAALERLPEPASPEAVALGLELAVGSLFGADYPATREWTARALAGARPLGDPASTATAAGALAMAEAFCGATEAGGRPPGGGSRHRRRATRRRAGGTARRGRLPPLTAELHLDRFDDAATHAGRGLELARATGHMSPMLVPQLLPPRRGCCADGSPTRRGSSTARSSGRGPEASPRRWRGRSSIAR